jgi:hypothetical protein
VFAGAARGAVFSNREVIRRVNAEFIPVALKAGQVNNPPDGDEGRLYREIGRSKAAPQGICVVNSAGKVLDWALMFDDEPSILGFLDHVLKRYASFPGAEKPVAAERFMRYPGQKLNDVEDDVKPFEVPSKHPEGRRCLGATEFSEGTLVGRTWGRALKEGKPSEETQRQELYLEDRFEIPVDVQEALAKAAAGAGKDRFRLPDSLGGALVGSAFLGMLDVNPLGSPGGRNERKEWEFWGRNEGGRVRLEGTSAVAGGPSAEGARSDGRSWSHEVTLAWRGLIELKGDRVSRLLAVAEGRDKLKWNGRMIQAGESEVAQLPAGRRIDLDTDVRFGFEARPAAGAEIGPGGAGAPLPERLQKLGQSVGEFAQAGGDLRKIKPEIEKLQRHLENGDFQAAEKQLEKILELLKQK